MFSFDNVSDGLYEIENGDELLKLQTLRNMNDEENVHGMRRWNKHAKKMLISYATSPKFSLVEKETE